MGHATNLHSDWRQGRAKLSLLRHNQVFLHRNTSKPFATDAIVHLLTNAAPKKFVNVGEEEPRGSLVARSGRSRRI